LTTFLTENFKFIAIEDLNVKGMMKNSKLSKAISDMAFYEFKRQLQYKVKIKENYFHVVDMWFQSSKTCSNCGNKKEKLSLSERTYICEKCELEIDRDLNASINLHNQLPTVHREVKPLETQALNLEAGLSDLTSVVELGNKHQKYLTISSFE
jgi:putative transposase